MPSDHARVMPREQYRGWCLHLQLVKAQRQQACKALGIMRAPHLVFEVGARSRHQQLPCDAQVPQLCGQVQRRVPQVVFEPHRHLHRGNRHSSDLEDPIHMRVPAPGLPELLNCGAAHQCMALFCLFCKGVVHVNSPLPHLGAPA